MLYRQSNKETKSEGKRISKISVRLSSDHFQKLNEILDQIGVGALKNGDDRSEKLRKFIDVLHSHYFSTNPVAVTTHKPEEEWFCLKGEPRHPNPKQQEMKCEVCKARDWNRWKACQDYKRRKKNES